jgi:hypothetical protein
MIRISRGMTQGESTPCTKSLCVVECGGKLQARHRFERRVQASIGEITVQFQDALPLGSVGCWVPLKLLRMAVRDRFVQSGVAASREALATALHDAKRTFHVPEQNEPKSLFKTSAVRQGDSAHETFPVHCNTMPGMYVCYTPHSQA